MKNTNLLNLLRKFTIVLGLGILFSVIGTSAIFAQKSTKNQVAKNRAAKSAKSTPVKSTPPVKSLYERLGGYDAVSAVVESFANKLFDDPKISKFFVGMSTDSREQFKQKNKNLVCNVTGGPCKIISRTAKTTHAGLGITEENFMVVVQHLIDTLNEFKVPEKEQKELLTIIGSLRPDIVEKK